MRVFWIWNKELPLSKNTTIFRKDNHGTQPRGLVNVCDFCKLKIIAGISRGEVVQGITHIETKKRSKRPRNPVIFFHMNSLDSKKGCW